METPQTTLRALASGIMEEIGPGSLIAPADY